MGGNTSTVMPKQVLMVGLDGSGKTKFLYENYAFTWTSKDANTKGFNYEVVDMEYGKIGIWDLGGSEQMLNYWFYFYQKIKFDGVIFMIDCGKIKAIERLDLNEKLLNFLFHEEELKDLPFAIYFNPENPDGESKFEEVLLHPFFQMFIGRLKKTQNEKVIKLELIMPTKDVNVKEHLRKWLSTKILMESGTSSS